MPAKAAGWIAKQLHHIVAQSKACQALSGGTEQLLAWLAQLTRHLVAWSAGATEAHAAWSDAASAALTRSSTALLRLLAQKLQHSKPGDAWRVLCCWQHTIAVLAAHQRHSLEQSGDLVEACISCLDACAAIVKSDALDAADLGAVPGYCINLADLCLACKAGRKLAGCTAGARTLLIEQLSPVVSARAAMATDQQARAAAGSLLALQEQGSAWADAQDRMARLSGLCRQDAALCQLHAALDAELIEALQRSFSMRLPQDEAALLATCTSQLLLLLQQRMLWPDFAESFQHSDCINTSAANQSPVLHWLEARQEEGRCGNSIHSLEMKHILMPVS